MDIDRINKNLQTSIFGKNLFYLHEIDSTNNYALKLAKEGSPEGTVVVADYQTKGKGRLDRNWYSAPGENLLLSILIYPEQEIELVQKITLAAANILIESIESYFKKHHYNKVDINVKWPNDLLINGKKTAGILTESILREKHIKALVIGFGINLNTLESKMPLEIKETATSLIEFTKEPVIIEDFLAHFLYCFEQSYFVLERTNYSQVVPVWKKYCKQFGKTISIETSNGNEEVCFYDINDEGHLIYRRTDGELKELISGTIVEA